jgi:hypothetical protein
MGVSLTIVISCYGCQLNDSLTMGVLLAAFVQMHKALEPSKIRPPLHGLNKSFIICRQNDSHVPTLHI